MRAEPNLPTSPPELEAVIDEDRAFFDANPWRTTRMRPTARSEIEAFVRVGQSFEPLMLGYLWVTVVHQVVPGGRIRRFCQLPVGMPLDPAECVCLDLFRYLAGAPDTVIGRIERENCGRLH